jgi:DNA polymerase epsilon subunit 1
VILSFCPFYILKLVTTKLKGILVDGMSGFVCGRAFHALRSLVGRWALDVSSQYEYNVRVSHFFPVGIYSVIFPQVYAGLLLAHLYRWLNSSDSCLYDPGLLRLVRQMMKKIFLQLTLRLKQMGAKLLFANFHKVYETHCLVQL